MFVRDTLADFLSKERFGREEHGREHRLQRLLGARVLRGADGKRHELFFFFRTWIAQQRRIELRLDGGTVFALSRRRRRERGLDRDRTLLRFQLKTRNPPCHVQQEIRRRFFQAVRARCVAKRVRGRHERQRRMQSVAALVPPGLQHGFVGELGGTRYTPRVCIICRFFLAKAFARVALERLECRSHRVVFKAQATFGVRVARGRHGDA